MKNVLILGAGLVVKPMVNYLADNHIFVTIASRTQARAEAMLPDHTTGRTVKWTVDQEEKLDELVNNHEVVVSMLPYTYHPLVAKKCIRFQKHMITTSYVQPEMISLGEPAEEAGILILNEMGVDPGIDHMSAKRIIDQVHRNQGKIKEFYSITGALAAPESADNPLRYKFSWSPRGVVRAGNNPAKYMKAGKEVNIPAKDLFKRTFTTEFPEVGQLEVYANRDSKKYIDIYDIPEAQTIFRGTFRYKGWCETIDAMKELNLLSDEPTDLAGMTLADLVAHQVGEKDSSNIRKKVARHLDMPENANALDALEWLGLFSQQSIEREKDSPFEVTSDLMLEKMKLGKDERDMVAMQHTFLVEYADKAQEVIRSRLLSFGDPQGDTAIARTVALPAAIAVKMILDGKINLKGIYRPVVPEIYEPVLAELEQYGIRVEETFGLPPGENIKLLI